MEHESVSVIFSVNTDFIFFCILKFILKSNCKEESVIFLKKYASNKPFYYGALELFGHGRTCLERYFDVVEWINKNY